jgi:hypothetical protein
MTAKYFIFRRRGNIISLVLNGGCLKFIEHYLKHNISEEELQNYIVYEATELNAKDILAGKFKLPEQNGSGEKLESRNL